MRKRQHLVSCICLKQWLVNLKGLVSVQNFVLNSLSSTFGFLIFDFFLTHTGGDFPKPVHSRQKYVVESTYPPEIRYLCLDWLKRLRQSQMTQRMRSDWSEACCKVKSYPRVNSEICFRLLHKKSNSEKLYRKSQSDLVKNVNKKDD